MYRINMHVNHSSDNIIWILLDRSWSRDAVKLIARCEQSKMADDEHIPGLFR